MNSDIARKSQEVLERIKASPNLSCFVGSSEIPKVFCRQGPARLIFLGQDPTIVNPTSRLRIKTVLDLENKKGHLYKFLKLICDGLGLCLDEHVYATNLFKNFFSEPPNKIQEINVLKEFLPFWLPVLQEELSQFPEVPIITLGEPVLKAVVGNDASLRSYWGYNQIDARRFSFVPAPENRLNKVIFPFPHLSNSKATPFYGYNFQKYVAFVKMSLAKK